MAIKKSFYCFMTVFIVCAYNICRVENILLPSHIVNAPFMAHLFCSDNHHCGGVILNEHIILTAGHCIYTPRISVKAGGNNMFSKTLQTIDVEKTLRHENYEVDPNEIQPYYDIALLLLKKPLEFNSFVHSIEWTDQIDIDKTATIYGWGSTNAFVRTHSIYSIYLRARNISLIADNLCKEMLTKTITKVEKQIYELCGEKAVCHGDSGGSVTQVIGNVTKLIGIVSWTPDHNIDCNTGPSTFVNVGYFADWINDGIRMLMKENVTESMEVGDDENLVST